MQEHFQMSSSGLPVFYGWINYGTAKSKLTVTWFSILDTLNLWQLSLKSWESSLELEVSSFELRFEKYNSVQFSLLFCHKMYKKKKILIFKKLMARKPKGDHRAYKEWASSVKINYYNKI